MSKRKNIFFAFLEVFKKYLKSFVVIVAFFLLSCKGETDSSFTIDIEHAFNQTQEILLSDFIEHLDYVVLASENPVGHNLKVYSSGNYLICIALRQMCVFDRETGMFIREIGSFGNGPGEYLSSDSFLEKNQHVVARRGKDVILEYDLNGKQINSVSVHLKDKEGGDSGSWIISGSTFLDDNSVVYFNNNTSGNEKDRLLIADKEGEVFKIFNNPNRFERQRGMISSIPPVFYHYNEQTLFFEICIDTIYHVTKDSLIPKYHLNMGQYKPPYEKQNMLMGPPHDPLINQYFWFRNMGETDRYLFFEFNHQRSTSQWSESFFGYYNKTRKSVKIADVYLNQKRIINDIDHFGVIQLPSWTINNERNEMTSYIEAVDIVEWFEQNPLQAKELPEQIQKLSQLKPDDNPVVVIAKLK